MSLKPTPIARGDWYEVSLIFFMKNFHL